MTESLRHMKEDILDAHAKLKQWEKVMTHLQDGLSRKTAAKTRLHKENWRKLQNKATYERLDDVVYTEGEYAALEERVELLQQRVKELQQLIALMDDDEIITFEDGHYTNDMRDTIMALLGMNVLAMNVLATKVTKVIRVALKNMANKSMTRLPKFWHHICYQTGSEPFGRPGSCTGHARKSSRGHAWQLYTW